MAPFASAAALRAPRSTRTARFAAIFAAPVRFLRLLLIMIPLVMVLQNDRVVAGSAPDKVVVAVPAERPWEG